MSPEEFTPASAGKGYRGPIRGRANQMVNHKHKPKWHASEPQRSNARAVRPRFQRVSVRSQAPFGPCVTDFVCHAARLIVEVDSGQHFEPKTMARDARRDPYLAAQGCGVVHLNNQDVIRNKAGVLEKIAVALGGSETPSLTLCRLRGRGSGHAGREDVP
jgi:very-short-patch-repair endonuclease